MTERTWNLTSVVACGCVAVAITGTALADSGLQDLIARLGNGNQPTGAGVVVGQVEAPPSGSLSYAPDSDDPGVSAEGRQFIHQSGEEDPLGHATQVGIRFYGTLGLAPGIMTIHNWAANDWLLDGMLRTGEPGIEPNPTPGGVKVINHSWVGAFPTEAASNDALRRADYLVNRDDVIVVAGASVPAIEGFPALLGPMFNGIMVGLASGEHTTGDVPDGLDGAGRMTPDIVADGSSTSWATPKVSGAAALLVETARGIGTTRGTNPSAQRSDVIKSVLLAGAHRDATWDNNAAQFGLDRGITDRPLDETFGAGALNINTAHMILTAGEQNGAAKLPDADNIAHKGWDLVSLIASRNAYYRFTIDDVAEELSVLVTWHRWVDDDLLDWALPDFNLELWSVDESNALQPLIGNFGLGVFASGNVVSDSEIDNVELLRVQGLEPGEYVIQLSRDDLLGTPFMADAAIAWCIPEPPCPGDVDGDGTVDLDDLLIVIAKWGTDGSQGGDLNNDDIVDLSDLLEVIANWGLICG